MGYDAGDFFTDLFHAFSGGGAYKPGTQVSEPYAGFGTPAANYDPNTGKFYDPRLGLYFSLPEGYEYDPATGNFVYTETGQVIPPDLMSSITTSSTYTQVMDPGGAALVAGANLESKSLLDALNEYQQQQRAGFAGEQGLAETLNRTINDPNAPSVARAQLVDALNQSQAQQLSAAAGVSGDNAALARNDAMRNMSELATRSSNEQTRLRAQETAQAQAALAAVYNAMAQQGQAGYNANLQGASEFSKQALGGQTELETGKAKADEKEAEREQKAFGVGASAISGLIG